MKKKKRKVSKETITLILVVLLTIMGCEAFAIIYILPYCGFAEC